MTLDFSPYKKVIIEGEEFDTGRMMCRPENAQYQDFMLKKLSGIHDTTIQKYPTPGDAFKKHYDRIKDLLSVVLSYFNIDFDIDRVDAVFRTDVADELYTITRLIFSVPVTFDEGTKPEEVYQSCSMMLTMHLLAYIMNKKKFMSLEELSVVMYVIHINMLTVLEKAVRFGRTTDFFSQFGGIGSGG